MVPLLTPALALQGLTPTQPCSTAAIVTLLVSLARQEPIKTAELAELMLPLWQLRRRSVTASKALFCLGRLVSYALASAPLAPPPQSAFPAALTVLSQVPNANAILA